jgi:ATP-dependent helicase/nuclease subunit B
MQLHIKQLQTFCEMYPIEKKVLIVPAMTTGHDVTMALARAGVSWVNLQIATPVQLAKEDALGGLIAEGWTQMVRDVDLFLVDDLIVNAVRELADDYFSRQAPGLARSFLRTLQALRGSGIDRIDHSTGHIRHRLLANLYEAYVAALQRDKVYDDAFLYRRALGCISTDNTQYAVLDETLLPGLAFDFVREKTAGRLWRIGYGQMGGEMPVHCAGVRFAGVDFPLAVGHVGVGASLFGSGLTAANKGQFRLRETLGVETEIRSVLRDLRAEGIPLDDVEIAYTVEQPYQNLLCDLVQRFEIPSTFAGGMPVNTTRVGQALIGFYRWIGSGFLSDEWVWLCRSGLVTFGQDEPTPAAAATLVRQARISEGRARYGEGLSQMKHRISERDPDGGEGPGEVKVSTIEAVEAVLTRVFGIIPEGPTVSLQEVAKAGATFLDQFAATAESEEGQYREGVALVALLAFLTQVQNSENRKGSLRALASRLTDMLGGRTFGVAPAKPRCVAIAPLSLAGYSNRKHLYLLGMDGGSFPGGAIEDPLLLDGERADLSGELALHRTRPAEQVWHLSRVLAMAPGRVTMVSCRRSLADGRERYPAAVFQQAAGQMGLHEEEVEVVPPIPEKAGLALDQTEGILAQFPFENYEGFVGAAFPWMGAGQKARQARQADKLTRYDGWLGVETPELAITNLQSVFSPSRLEMLARCPYRYFLNAVLGVQPLEEPEDDPTRWLDPLAFGSLLHQVFKVFMQTVKGRGEKPNRISDEALILTLVHAQVMAKKETEPVIHQAAFRADVKRLEQVALVFLSVESAAEEVDPVGFEVSFGFGETGDLCVEEPVTLALAKDMTFRLRGRIDRVDEQKEGFAIWDYKTGSMSQYDERDLLKRGTHLQWALYAYALDKVLNQHRMQGQVLLSGYVFPGDREHGRKLSASPPVREALATVLRPLFELVNQGGFFHIQKEQECTYCGYNRICANERVDNKKMEDIREAMAGEQAFTELLDSLNRWMDV